MHNDLLISSLSFIANSGHSNLKSCAITLLSRLLTSCPPGTVDFFTSCPTLLPTTIKSCGSLSSASPLINLLVVGLLLDGSKKFNFRSDKKLITKLFSLIQREDLIVTGKVLICLSLLIAPGIGLTGDEVLSKNSFDFKCKIFLIEKTTLFGVLETIFDEMKILKGGESHKIVKFCHSSVSKFLEIWSCSVHHLVSFLSNILTSQVESSQLDVNLLRKCYSFALLLKSLFVLPSISKGNYN
ncbi:hypothetical protein GEMRC1_012399 [Eukaryota sp. GEM-RC1]